MNRDFYLKNIIMDEYVIVDDTFTFLDTEYDNGCSSILDKQNVILIYPFIHFYNEIVGNMTYTDIYNQAKIDFNRSLIYYNNNLIRTFSDFLTLIYTDYTTETIYKILLFTSQTLYAKIVTEIGLKLNNFYIGECSDIQRIEYSIANDNFKSSKTLRIFGIDNNGNDYTIKNINIKLSCHLLNEDYMTINLDEIFFLT